MKRTKNLMSCKTEHDYPGEFHVALKIINKTHEKIYRNPKEYL